jgi:CheY-like chemotaxis protein
MSEGGVLVLETRNVDVTPSQALQNPQLRPGSYLRLTVADSGVGMDQATLSRIFEPFFTTKPTGVGTGLGLATVYGIVQQSHGSITVYSEVGRGTTFHIYLPRVDKAPVVEDGSENNGETPGGMETILLVEDEAPVRDLVKLLLQEAGYRVLTAATPHEALRLEQEHDEPLDLLLTDVVMPKMNGQELVRLVTLRRPNTRAILMSGYTEDVILYRNLMAAGTPLLEKPFAPAKLLRLVRQTLDQPQSPAAMSQDSTSSTP